MKSNGTEFRAFVAQTAVYLTGLQVASYYGEPFGSADDEKLTAVVQKFMAASPPQRTLFLAEMEPSRLSLFGVYGHRAATMAVRGESRETLLQGLVGAAIANYIIPPNRKVEVALTVYHHCARKLGVNVVDLFEEAAVYASPELAPKLIAFGKRGDVTLRRYGWREVKTMEGVKYTFSGISI